MNDADPKLQFKDSVRERRSGSESHARSDRRIGCFGTLFSFFGGVLRLTIAAMIFFGIVVVASYFAIGYWVRGQEIVAPNVTAQSVDEALEELRQYQLSLELKRTEPSDALPAGAILSQEPRPGSKIKTQTPIRVVVSAGPRLVDVPRNLVGIGRLQAGIELRKANLELGNVAVIRTEGHGHDIVLASDPPPGSSIVPGAKINLLVSSEATGEEILMPDLYGLTPERARSELARAGLELESTIDEWHPDAAPGTIHRQEPAPGRPVQTGALIRIYVNPAPRVQMTPQWEPRPFFQ